MDHSQLLQWLNLFDLQIVRLLIANQQYWALLQDLLPDGRFEELKHLAHNGQLEATAQQLWIEVKSTTCESLLLFKVCEFVKNADSKLSNLIAHRNISSACLSSYLSTLSKLGPYICSRSVIDYFCGYSPKAYAILHPIWEHLTDGTDEAEARQLLLHVLPFISSSATEHLIYAVWKTGNAEAQLIIRQNWPNFENLIDHIKSVESKPKRIVITSGVSIEYVFNSLDTHQHDPFSKLELPKVYKSSVDPSLCKEVQIRDYQQKLAERALLGENIIICAPTNSGKTYVAAHIIGQHYRQQASKPAPKFKVAFIVPRRFLVRQQADVLERYFGDCLKIDRLVGVGDDEQLHSNIIDSDIVVLTPQMLLNNLSEPLSESKPVKIDSFSLLIFDECHDCKDGSPYNKILRIYHNTKSIFNVEIPQIIGLTASLGMGDSDTPKGAVKHAAKLCANMDCRHIAVVKNNLDQFQKHVPSTPESISICEQQSTGFLEVLEGLKSQLECQLVSLLKEFGHTDLSELSEEAFRIQNFDDLHSALNQILIRAKQTMMMDNLVRQRAILNLDHLIAINESIQCAHLFDKNSSIGVLRKHLKRVSQHRLSQQVTQLNDALQKLETMDEFVSKILSEFIRILMEDLDQNKDTRCLVFIRTRDNCIRLARLIEQYTTLKTDYLIGCNTRTENQGLSDHEQQERLQAFKNGQIAVLVATSVAEEGMDVSNCNLVVKFDYVSGPVAHVQRRGRGRAEGTRSILLAGCESTKVREKANILKEERMKEALAFIDQNPLEFQKQIDDQMQKNKEERDAMRLEEAKQESKMTNSFYIMACGRCRTFLAHSSDIYLLHDTHYVVADASIWERVSLKRFQPSFKGGLNAPFVGTIYCKGDFQQVAEGCGNKLGSVVHCPNHGFVEFPVFTCKGAVFFVDVGNDREASQIPDEAKEHFKKKWIEVTRELFKPRPIGYYQIIEMLPITDLFEDPTLSN